MANQRGKHVDSTYLSLDNATERGFIHRDYIAHCLRWSHVAKYLQDKKRYETARVLDIGCGRELPLPKLLYSSRFIVSQYYGVDIGPVEQSALDVFHSGKFPLAIWDETDVCDLTLSDVGNLSVNTITCFECLEHVEPTHMLRILDKMRELLSDDGVIFISTPCWDRVSCAANHVNEMTHESLGAVFEESGLYVKNVWGTFASIKDYEFLLHRSMSGEQEHLGNIFDKLRAYYDVNVLSCIFAPLFPAQSRNCLWQLSKVPKDGARPRFNNLEDCTMPWGSSERWQEMRRKL